MVFIYPEATIEKFETAAETVGTKVQIISTETREVKILFF